MLFNSYEFLFLFLPITLLVYFFLTRWGGNYATLWLVAASLFFYGWWNPTYLLLIVTSILFNYTVGMVLGQQQSRPRLRTFVLIFGITANLILLVYYKYAGFIFSNLNSSFGTDFSVGEIILPLGISFFTFTQIAFLVDAWRGEVHEYDVANYALFVTFFPHLIAGPVLHHKDMMPQFKLSANLTPRAENFAVGLTIFFIGLFKKTVLADSIAQYGSPVFNSAAAGETLTFFEAWGGALAYTLQLYFDFSGYSDMAIGAARLFGIALPINFHSPYKATSIIEFWRRWHVTLSTFLRDYLYITLGGNRAGKIMRYRNLLLTMLLGGLWHGAGWTFVVWGALHGLYLCINHAWTHLTTRLFPSPILPQPLAKALAWTITFLAVVVGWVFFRATNFSAAETILRGMMGLNGIALPESLTAALGAHWPTLAGFGFTTYLGSESVLMSTWLWIACLLPVTLVMPNTQQILRHFEPGMHIPASLAGNEIRPLFDLVGRIQWAPSATWAVACAMLATLSALSLTRLSEFLYFQF